MTTASWNNWRYSVEADLRNFANQVEWFYSNPVEKVVSRCSGCGSSDFRGNRCMFCRRLR